MSATVVPFEDLQLKDDVYVIPGGASPFVRGLVTGLGPDKELTLNSVINFGTDAGFTFIVLTSED